MCKSFALTFILLLTVSSMIVVKSACAQTISTPSIPEFTIKTISLPYDVSPTSSITIDQYTGKQTVATQSGYHVENKTTEIRIKNQPFNGTIFYNIRFKGHFSQDWRYYRLHNGSSDGNLVQDNNSEYTIIPIDSYLPTEGQIDFQLEALTGYEQGIVTFPGVPGTSRVIIGENSGWSNIQTLSLPDGSVSITQFSNPTPTQTPISTTSPTPTLSQTLTPTSTIPEFPVLTIPLMLIIIAFARLLVYHKKRNY